MRTNQPLHTRTNNNRNTKRRFTARRTLQRLVRHRIPMQQMRPLHNANRNGRTMEAHNPLRAKSKGRGSVTRSFIDERRLPYCRICGENIPNNEWDTVFQHDTGNYDTAHNYHHACVKKLIKTMEVKGKPWTQADKDAVRAKEHERELTMQQEEQVHEHRQGQT